jgi:hypothetical protein
MVSIDDFGRFVEVHKELLSAIPEQLWRALHRKLLEQVPSPCLPGV